MTLIVQSDQGQQEGANAYCDVAFFRAHFALVGIDTSAHQDTAVEAALIAATRYLDVRYRYAGIRRNKEQTTQWPRFNAVDADGYYIQHVPEQVRQASCEVALRHLNGVSLMPDPDYVSSGQTVESKTVKVGPITESYTYAAVPGSSGVMLPKFPAVDFLLGSTGLVMSSKSRELRRG